MSWELLLPSGHPASAPRRRHLTAHSATKPPLKRLDLAQSFSRSQTLVATKFITIQQLVCFTYSKEKLHEEHHLCRHGQSIASLWCLMLGEFSRGASCRPCCIGCRASLSWLPVDGGTGSLSFHSLLGSCCLSWLLLKMPFGSCGVHRLSRPSGHHLPHQFGPCPGTHITPLGTQPSGSCQLSSPQRIALCLNSDTGLCISATDALRERRLNRSFPDMNMAARPGLATDGRE